MGATIERREFRHEDFALQILPERWRRRQLRGQETSFELELRLLLMNLVGPRRPRLQNRDQLVASAIQIWETWFREHVLNS